jgi:hypothetical protein
MKMTREKEIGMDLYWEERRRFGVDNQDAKMAEFDFSTLHSGKCTFRPPPPPVLLFFSLSPLPPLPSCFPYFPPFPPFPPSLNPFLSSYREGKSIVTPGQEEGRKEVRGRVKKGRKECTWKGLKSPETRRVSGGILKEGTKEGRKSERTSI